MEEVHLKLLSFKQGLFSLLFYSFYTGETSYFSPIISHSSIHFFTKQTVFCIHISCQNQSFLGTFFIQKVMTAMRISGEKSHRGGWPESSSHWTFMECPPLSDRELMPSCLLKQAKIHPLSWWHNSPIQRDSRPLSNESQVPFHPYHHGLQLMKWSRAHKPGGFQGQAGTLTQ